MRIYFTVLLCVAAVAVGLVFHFRVNAPSHGSGAAGDRWSSAYEDDPLYQPPPESLWPRLKEDFRQAVRSGGLLIKQPSRIIEDMGVEIVKTKRNLVIVDVDPSELPKVVQWFHVNRRSRLIEPFRLRFYSSDEQNGPQARRLYKPSWTVEFDCGLYARISDGTGEQSIEIP